MMDQPPWNLSQQSLSTWHEWPLTLEQMKICELVTVTITDYRSKNDPMTAPCWMDEWAYGYIVAMRDCGNITPMMALFLFSAFATPDTL